MAGQMSSCDCCVTVVLLLTLKTLAAPLQPIHGPFTLLIKINSPFRSQEGAGHYHDPFNPMIPSP